MATQRTARVLEGRPLGGHAALLKLAAPREAPVSFCGGQYIIVDTGLAQAGGKSLKRAYSLLSGDDQPDQLALAVRRIGAGPGSNYMNALRAGAELRFSGPWGKWYVQPDDPPPALIVATDTGITAALGLLRSAAFRPLLPSARLLWCVQAVDDFLPPTLVEELLPPRFGAFRTACVPPIGHGGRLAAVKRLVGEAWGRTPPRTAYLVGDGQVVQPLKSWLETRGMSESRVRTECFFNNPAKRSAG